LDAIDTGGIFDRFHKRFPDWIDFDTGGIFARAQGAIEFDARGIFDRFHKRFPDWIDIDTGGVFDRSHKRFLDWIDIEGFFGRLFEFDRLKHRERFTDERGNPSLAASFVALGDDTEALSYLFELRQQVFV
jgi:hypothetical protein